MNAKLIVLSCLMLLFAGCHSTKDVTDSKSKNVNQIAETYWKLKTLKGQEVEMAKGQERERYFMLKKKDHRLRGFSGCNTFSGIYSLDKENKIHFSHMASTLKACPEVEVNESKFLDIFERTDHYTINGDTLSLSKGDRAPLALFEAVYFD